MKISKTPVQDLLELDPTVYGDDRGYFLESYNRNTLSNEGIHCDFVQDNQSRSKYGVVRGLHYQSNPKAQTKLIRVVEGEIYDVALDIRKGSPTYGKWYGTILSAENFKQLFIPKGFAHGFSVLSDYATIMYKCDEFYAPEYDGGIIFNDPELSIDWKIPTEKIILSEKDSKLPTFANSKHNFEY